MEVITAGFSIFFSDSIERSFVGVTISFLTSGTGCFSATGLMVSV
jgi:hypothetical protein